MLFQPTCILLLMQVSFPNVGFLPLTHDEPDSALTPCSVPRAACLQNRLQLSCPRRNPSTCPTPFHGKAICASSCCAEAELSTSPTSTSLSAWRASHSQRTILETYTIAQQKQHSVAQLQKAGFAWKRKTHPVSVFDFLILIYYLTPIFLEHCKSPLTATVFQNSTLKPRKSTLSGTTHKTMNGKVFDIIV